MSVYTFSNRIELDDAVGYFTTDKRPGIIIFKEELSGDLDTSYYRYCLYSFDNGGKIHYDKFLATRSEDLLIRISSAGNIIHTNLK